MACPEGPYERKQKQPKLEETSIAVGWKDSRRMPADHDGTLVGGHWWRQPMRASLVLQKLFLFRGATKLEMECKRRVLASRCFHTLELRLLIPVSQLSHVSHPALVASPGFSGVGLACFEPRSAPLEFDRALNCVQTRAGRWRPLKLQLGHDGPLEYDQASSVDPLGGFRPSF